MASFAINNVLFSGVSAAVPKGISENLSNKNFDVEDIKKFIGSTGVERFRTSSELCTSDLVYHSAEALIKELNWDKDEIDILIFVSQTPDYYLPITAALLQDRLKLSTKCLAFDMILGCSGFVYGLSAIASYMANGKFRKGLLLCGDTPSKMVNKKDKSSALLFGDAGTAAAFEYAESAPPIYFTMGTDGAGYKAIIIEEGGFRNPINEDTLIEKESEPGIVRRGCDLVLDGMEVFSFGISQAPKTVKQLCEEFNLELGNVDYAVFHQANMMMNEMIRKKLKLEKEKVPYSLANFGNTSSASIPVTMVTELADKLRSQSANMVLCGFGVGLSWGGVYTSVENLVIPPLQEI